MTPSTWAFSIFSVVFDKQLIPSTWCCPRSWSIFKAPWYFHTWHFATALMWRSHLLHYECSGAHRWHRKGWHCPERDSPGLLWATAQRRVKSTTTRVVIIILALFGECLFCATNCSKGSTRMNTYNPQSFHRRMNLLVFSPFERWKNWGSERFIYFSWSFVCLEHPCCLVGLPGRST